jgi:hypothetical protein
MEAAQRMGFNAFEQIFFDRLALAEQPGSGWV